MKTKINYIFICSITFIVFSAYWPGLHGPFVFDDLGNITNNSLLRIQSLDTDSIFLSASSGSAGPLKRPVAMLSFAVNYYMGGGYESYIFKLTNIIIQTLCAGILFLVVQQLLATQAYSQQTRIKFIWLAAGITLLWALHPINLTSVLYIVQRMTSLSTLFSLGCISAYLAGRTRFESHAPKLSVAGFWVLSLCCWILAIYSKENALIIPLLIGWIEFTLFSKTSPWTQLHNFSARSRALINIAATSAVMILILYAIHYASGGYGNRPFTMSERVLTEARVVCFYISLIFIPRINAFGLFHDDITLSTSLLSPWTTIPSILFLFALVVSAFYFRKKNPLYALGIGWFFIGHALESTFFPLEIAHEHRNHFPSIGLILAASSWVIFSKTSSKKITAGFVFIALILGGTTWMRSTQWANYQRLAYYEAEHSPNSHAIQALLSNAAHKAGDIETATRAIKLAMELAPNESAYTMHYQNILAISGKVIPESIQSETLKRLRENRITPSAELALDHIISCINQGPCASLSGNYLEWVDTIIKKKPNTAYYHFLRGKALRAKGDQLSALNAFQKAYDLDKKYLHPLFEMADILLRAGQLQQAEMVITWIEDANQNTSYRRDKELSHIKEVLSNLQVRQDGVPSKTSKAITETAEPSLANPEN